MKTNAEPKTQKIGRAFFEVGDDEIKWKTEQNINSKASSNLYNHQYTKP